jgi:hypothetical protein
MLYISFSDHIYIRHFIRYKHGFLFEPLYLWQRGPIHYAVLCNVNTTLGYCFHIQHRNFETFPVEDLGHDSGRTLVRAEYGYPKGFPGTNSFY